MTEKKNTQQPSNNRLTLALLVFTTILLVHNYIFKDELAEAKGQQQGVLNSLIPSKGELFDDSNNKPKLDTPTKSITISNNTYNVTIDPQGGKITDIELNNFLVEKNKEEPVKILNSDSEFKMMFDAGWLADNITAPNINTNWQIKEHTANKLILTWTNKQNITFERHFNFVDGKFFLNLQDLVVNNSKNTVQLAHYSQLHHVGEREDRLTNSFTNYTGPEAIFDGKKVTADYKDLQEGQNFNTEGNYGWAGITKQYFAAAMIPDSTANNHAKFKYNKIVDKNFYTALIRSDVKTIEAGKKYSQNYQLYAGPKSTKILQEQGFDEKVRLTSMLDYGWFHFIAKPLFEAIMFIYNHINSLAIAIIIVTMLLKLALFPLANKSYHSMAEMRKIQPEMQKLQAKYGNDRNALGLEMMKLYKQHNVSPASGCWPILVQIPIFFAMYKVILMSFEFRQAELGLWIHDMSTRDPFFVLPLLMGATMFLQQRMNPQPLDETQKMVMNSLPIVFTVMFAFFPSGLVLYWLTNNILSITQQYFIMKRHK